MEHGHDALATTAKLVELPALVDGANRTVASAASRKLAHALDCESTPRFTQMSRLRRRSEMQGIWGWAHAFMRWDQIFFDRDDHFAVISEQGAEKAHKQMADIQFTQEEWKAASDLARILLERLGVQRITECDRCGYERVLLPNYAMKHELAKALRANGQAGPPDRDHGNSESIV